MFENWDLWSFLAGLVGGVAITFVSIQIQKRMSSGSGGNTVDQSRAQAGGDIVGRDKK
jgi:hypothetical protein